MKNKSIVLFLLILILMPLIFSCTKSSEPEKASIVATNFAMYDFARELVGDNAEVTMLISPGSEAHDFEVSINDISKIRNADVFIYVGGESEDWVEDTFNALGDEAEEITTVCAIDTVTLLDEEYKEGMVPADEDDEEPDEHVWTSLSNAILIVDRIADTISSELPELKEIVTVNRDRYISELEELRSEMTEMVSSSKRNMILIADRFPFRYLTDELSLDYFAAFSGCTSKTEVSLYTINYLVNKANELDIPVIFTVEFSDEITARAVQEETGADILTLYSAHNVSKKDFDNGITYIDLMKHNMEVLKTALN